MSLRVLVADDAAFIRELLRELLQKNGCDVVGEASDGEEAVRKALELKPDVVFMDLIMPRMSGLQAIKQLLYNNKGARIIAMSTADQNLMVLKALDAGACEYLVKPFEIQAVMKALRPLIGSSIKDK